MKQILQKLSFTIVLFIGIISLSTAQGYSYHPEKIIIDNNNYDVVIYPNPVTDYKFSVKSSFKIKSVEVLNVIGQRVKKVENKMESLDEVKVKLPDCDEGVYMVKIIFINNKTSIKKIIVK